jgi:hypothetical protein
MPVPVCDKTGLGVASVAWTMAGTKTVEVHVDGPSGNLFVAAKAPGKQQTGPWVRSGTTFYLQNLGDKAKLDADHTLARVRVETTGGGPCP